MATLAIPVAFLARDQLRGGLMRGEQTALLALFGSVVAGFVAFLVSRGQLDFGTMPLGPAAVLMLLVLILRRTATPAFSRGRWT
jgi:hypothetical protein